MYTYQPYPNRPYTPNERENSMLIQTDPLKVLSIDLSQVGYYANDQLLEETYNKGTRAFFISSRLVNKDEFKRICADFKVKPPLITFTYCGDQVVLLVAKDFKQSELVKE